MRKTILCVGKNKKSLALRKFLLETRGYRVQLASSESEVLAGSQRSAYEDAQLLLCHAGEFSEDSVECMQAALPHAPIVVLGTETTSSLAFLEKLRLELRRFQAAALDTHLMS